MKNIYLIKSPNENFRIKLFRIFTIFIMILSATFILFFYINQRSILHEKLITEGEILIKLFAYNARIPTFAEDPNTLNHICNGMLAAKGILETSVFNDQKKLIILHDTESIGKRQSKDTKIQYVPEKIYKELNEHQHTIYQEYSNELEFWHLMVSDKNYRTEHSLFFPEEKIDTTDNENNIFPQVIGYVNIKIDKTPLNKKLRKLLYSSIMIGLLFLIFGSLIVYFIADTITRPLKRLTESVIEFGRGNTFKQVIVETRDEIGRLAGAFNDMYQSLQKREEEKLRLEEQLRHAQKMEAIGTLAGGVAHDFNNILTAIIGFGNLTKIEIGETEPGSFYLTQILSSAERAARLTKSLMAYSRKQPIELTQINLNTIIMDVGKLLVRLISSDVQITINTTQEELNILADDGQIEQVLFNLVTNANDAMPHGGTITISTESVHWDRNLSNDNNDKRSERFALLKVHDTGIGIDKKIQERIFDPFFTTKEVGKGTGLGLSIVYGIIKEHNGHINVYSDHLKGTTFNIFFPLLDSAIENKKATPLCKPKGGNETILLAEDDESVRKLSQSVLEQYGYKVISAQNGEEAVEDFKKYREEIQLLLFDVIMPKKNGVDSFEEINKLMPGIKIIFISGYDFEILDSKNISKELVNFLSKPVSPDVLLAKVRNVLDQN